jgi:hypothetical protein
MGKEGVVRQQVTLEQIADALIALRWEVFHIRHTLGRMERK